MSKLMFVNIIVLLFIQVILTDGYSVPEITVQALNNGEFRALIPDSPGLKRFDVHAKINAELSSYDDPQALSSQVTQNTNGYWIAKFSGNNIKIGDTINIWVLVIIDSFKYRKQDTRVTIAELSDNYPQLKQACVMANTKYNDGRSTCIGYSLLDEEFHGNGLDYKNWNVEQWIPTYTPPGLIFNSYENRDETRFVKDDMLHIKPIALQNNADVRGTLDLTNGCTLPLACSLKQHSYLLLPPVRSARLTSKISFKYGKISIRAKLPAGDWIFPVIQLEEKSQEIRENSPKIVIAYSRGNNVLKNNQIDIGSRTLLGGPVKPEEGPTNTLVSWLSREPYYNQFHVYTLEWIPGKMTMKVDDTVYGEIDISKTFADQIDIRGGGSSAGPFNKELVLSLGVAVGGVLDFPDEYTSGNYQKPWNNTDPKRIYYFFEKRSEWSSTWKGDDAALRVDYVKITAV